MKPEEIKEARKRLKLTQAKFADKIGVHEKTISNYEHGRTEIPKYIEIAVYALLCDLNGRF